MTNPFTGFSLHKIAYGATPATLQLYLNDRGYLTDWNFLELKEKEGARKYADIITEQLKQFSKTDKSLLGELMKVFVIAKRDALLGFMYGLESMIGQPLLEHLNTLSSNYDRTLVLLMQNQDVFAKYYCLYTANAESKKYWSIREDYVPGEATSLTEEEIAKLKTAVSDYMPKEMRGNQCKCVSIDYRGRQYLFLMTGDLPKHEEIWDGEEASGIILQPIYKIAIVYDCKTREVDIYCRDKKTRTVMHRIFAREKFSQEIPDRPLHPPIYDIDGVLATLIEKKKLDIKIPQGSPVQDIWVKSIQFYVPKHEGMLVIESKIDTRTRGEGQVDHIYAVLRRFLKLDASSTNSVPPDDVRISWVQFIVQYKDIYDGGSLIQKSFNFSGRDNTNLGHSDIDREIKACLIASGYIRKNHVSAAEVAAENETENA